MPNHGCVGWLARAGGIAADEMLRVFNCGVGMVLVVAAVGVCAWVHGRTTNRPLLALTGALGGVGSLVALFLGQLMTNPA